jgi:hypothetical protein
VFLVLAACTHGFDARRQVDVLDSRVGPKRTGDDVSERPEAPDIVHSKLVNELFVVVPIATDVDPFPRRPRMPSLAQEAKLHYSMKIRAYGSGDKSVRFQYHGVGIEVPYDFTRFEKEVAPLLVDAAQLPPGDGLLFQWAFDQTANAAVYDAWAVKAPPLATVRDVAGAAVEMHETKKLDPSGVFKPAVSQSIRVTFTPEATTRLTRWASGREGHPMATAVRGRIMDVSAIGNATTVWLDFDWLPEEERKPAAELLANELRRASGH